MTTTVGQPERSQWSTRDMSQAFADEAVTARGYLNFPGDLEDHAVEVADGEATADPYAYAAEPTSTVTARRRGSADLVRSVIADSMGVAVDDPAMDDIQPESYDDVIQNDLVDPQSVLDALDRQIERADRVVDLHRKKGSSDGLYQTKEANWREAHGMPRQRQSVPPSKTPEGRRAYHLGRLVASGKYPDMETAERSVEHRKSAGKPKHKKKRNVAVNP